MNQILQVRSVLITKGLSTHGMGFAKPSETLMKLRKIANSTSVINLFHQRAVAWDLQTLRLYWHKPCGSQVVMLPLQTVMRITILDRKMQHALNATMKFAMTNKKVPTPAK